MSRTFEALQKAERERKQGPGARGESPSPGGREPLGLSLPPPAGGRQQAALDLDRALQGHLRSASAPVLWIPAVDSERFAGLILDSVSSLTLRLELRCLVVDANLRAPFLHRFAGVPRSRGVADLLGGKEAEVRRLFVSGTGGTVGFLPAGGGRPADEAWPERLAAWLDDVAGSYDRVFVAGPAVDEADFQASLLDTVAGAVLVAPPRGRRIAISGKIEALIEPKLLGIVAVG